MKWEYRTEVMPVRGLLRPRITQGELDTALNKLGQEGWELITCLVPSAATTRMVLIFKRQSV